MNCEKCKNKKATFFYADEGGSRHALCASCGASQGKTLSISVAGAQGEDKPPEYLPEFDILSLFSITSPSVPAVADDSGIVCRGCGLSIAEAHISGGLGCPDCYEAFATHLLPDLPSSVGNVEVRMPYLRRKRLEREKALSSLRDELKSAIRDENFELAVTLRDRIRSIEND